jgi:prevent-host-death family protein
MKLVNYEDLPAMCDELLDEVESTGITIEVVKNGRPCARIEPVDEATKALFEARRKRR